MLNHSSFGPPAVESLNLSMPIAPKQCSSSTMMLSSSSPIPSNHYEKSNKSGKKRSNQNGLRKGKWTSEEEIFTMKTIEAFNEGLLLTDDVGGTTLRAYLADKLACDPMRITKKFTGAACLGKKVYHRAESTAYSKEKLEEVQRDLHYLEQKFTEKIKKIERDRLAAEKGSKLVEIDHFISSPAIDAMLNNRPQPYSSNSDELSSKSPSLLHSAPYLYPNAVPVLNNQQLQSSSSSTIKHIPIKNTNISVNKSNVNTNITHSIDNNKRFYDESRTGHMKNTLKTPASPVCIGTMAVTKIPFSDYKLNSDNNKYDNNEIKENEITSFQSSSQSPLQTSTDDHYLNNHVYQNTLQSHQLASDMIYQSNKETAIINETGHMDQSFFSIEKIMTTLQLSMKIHLL